MVNFRHHIKTAKAKRITLHGFRHSHVSLLIKLGYDKQEVADRAGDTLGYEKNVLSYVSREKKSNC